MGNLFSEATKPHYKHIYWELNLGWIVWPSQAPELVQKGSQRSREPAGQRNAHSLRRARLLSSHSTAGPGRCRGTVLDIVTAQHSSTSAAPGESRVRGKVSCSMLGAQLLAPCPPACAKEDARGEAVPGRLEAGKGFLAGGRHWDTTATRAEWSLQAVSVWFGKGDPVVSAEPQPWVRRALTTSVLSYERKVFYPPKERRLPMAEQSPVSPWLSLRGLRC